ncbi:hypothetical protein KUV57_12250 [Epibacterium sp. DP7N7-1]|nr:hypothetical protein [Epibacterium sp. DP7N7-1]
MADKKLIPELELHFAKLADRLGSLKTPLHAYIAGGIAVNYHTGYRMSDDVDVQWSHRVAIPPDMQVIEVADENDPDEYRMVTIDAGFADVLGSFPPEWEGNSPVICQVGDIVLHVMDPVDLAVSKVARFQDRDREDIVQLARHGLIDVEKFEQRGKEALEYFIGNTKFVEYNLRDAVELIKKEIDEPEPS